MLVSLRSADDRQIPGGGSNQTPRETSRKQNMIQDTCQQCGKPIKARRHTTSQLFCTRRCANKKERNKIPRNEFTSTGDCGAFNELTVCADLLRKKFHVFRSVSPTGPCDLIAMKKNTLWRIEVTTGCHRKDGSVGWVPHNPANYDVIAVVLPNGSVIYTPEAFSGEPDFL
jgi:hypothetical protein